MLKVKKLICLFLTIVLVSGMIPVTATAATGEDSAVTRYTVLVLDTSSTAKFTWDGEPIYTADTAINHVKAAAKSFLKSILYADGKNYVAIVSYKATAQVVSEFTDDIDSLSVDIDNLYASGETRDISAGLSIANELISDIQESDTVKKNVVLFTTGMTNNGAYSYDGHYSTDTVGSNWHRTDTGIHLYAYANNAYDVASNVKAQATLYVLGLFQTMKGMPEEGTDIAAFFKLTARDLASSDNCFYEVNDPSDLEFEFGEVAEDILSSVGKFNYAGEYVKSQDSTAEYYYTDNYFSKDPERYNSSLATMSLCLELSTFSSYNYDDWYDPSLTEDDELFWKDKLVNVKTLLLGSPDEAAVKNGYGGLGFDHFSANGFWEKVPEKDSIGVVAARKQITEKATGKEYTLVALVIRGGGYGSEWSSNFTIGEDGDHQGFAQARDDVLAFLVNYLGSLDNTESPNIKLWIVGYSRAGATANMVAGAINEGYTLPHPISDIFCYTFEAPMGVLGENIIGTHKNIHNVVNLNDLVPYVAPYKWGFVRYNQDSDWPLPTAQAANDWDKEYDAMIEELEKLGYQESDYAVPELSTKKNLKIDKSKFLPFGDPLWWWEESEADTETVLVDAVDYLAEDVIKSRAYYVENLQHMVRQVLGVVKHYDGMGAGIGDYAGEVFDVNQFMKNFSELFTMDNIVYIISPMLDLNPFYSYDDRVEDVELRLMKKLGSVFEEYAEINGFIDAIAECLRDVILQVAADAWNNNTDSVNLIVKFVDILTNGLLNAHFPEVSLAWVRSQDPNFNKDYIADKVNSSITRVIRINCPVNVNVYNSEKVLVASILDDVVIDCNSSIVCYINDNSEKIVYLPGDEEYTVEITATDNGKVSYSLSEFNYLCGGETRLLNYYDVNVTEGDVLTGVVPEISASELEENAHEGSTVGYRLLHNNSIVEPDETYSGNAIPSERYDVVLRVDAVDGEYAGGYVDGAGSFLKGNFAQIEAYPLPNSTFYGWYDENDTLISEDQIYRFAVREDTILTAKFDSVSFHEIQVNSTYGGKVIDVNGYYTADMEISLVAEADSGYKFVGWTSSGGGMFEDASNMNTTFTIPDNDVTITANFQKEGLSPTTPASPSYQVKISDSIDGGTVTTNRSSVSAGKTVTITVTPDDNYILDTITVTDKRGNEVKLTDNGNGKYIFTMPSSNVTVQATFTMYKEDAPAISFVDVLGDIYYHDAVLWAVENGITKGTDDTHFSPNAPCNRAQAVTFLWRAAGSPTPKDSTMPFTDVDAGSYYYNAVLWAVENGITKGTSDTTFSPNATCSRGQIVTFLWRSQKSPAADSENPFTDVNSGDYYADAVLWAVKNGITNGTSDTTFSPADDCTRSQIVTLLWRMLQRR
ncbi:MAG: S-layer homology domain-containing protein [Eubacteriaceae bacterium]|nr:S-layer homology domain-containing protein [Eubacteriaceae bacterium]